MISPAEDQADDGNGCPMNGATPTRTVERALALLASVCDGASPSLTECARTTDLPASTALRLLRTLESAGFVARDDEGIYRAGSRLVQLGARALAQQPVVEACRPAMARLVEATGESTYLCLPGPGSSALYVAGLEGTHSIRHTNWVGRTGPLEGSAAGAALTGQVPSHGFVTKRSAIEPDVTAIAAPVRHPGGVIAALSVVGPAYRIDDHTAAAYGRLLVDEASRVSAALGSAYAQAQTQSARHAQQQTHAPDPISQMRVMNR